MKTTKTIICALLAIGLAAYGGATAATQKPSLRLLFLEVQPGALSSEQFCMLVFDDHQFHLERAQAAKGNAEERKIYQGQLSDSDWQTLTAILDAKSLRELRVPPATSALVVPDSHPYTISVARKGGFQNMEFVNRQTLKPYASQLKPLLDWWKTMRKIRLPESGATADPRCALNDANAVFTN